MANYSSPRHWNREAFDEGVMNSNNVETNYNRTESVTSDMDFEDLRDRVTDLSVERRPVQHPSGNENGLPEHSDNQNYEDTLDSNTIEISLDGNSTLASNFNSTGLSHEPQRGRMTQGVNYLNPARQPQTIYKNATVTSQPRHEQGVNRFLHQPSEQQYPGQTSPHYSNHHPRENKQLSPNQSGKHQACQPGDSAYTDHPTNMASLIEQQNGLDNGFRSEVRSFGFEESMTDIAAPAPVPRQGSDYGSQVSSPDPILSNHKPQYTHQDSKDSVGSDSYSFTTMPPSFEDRLPVEQKNEDRKVDRDNPHQNPIPTVSNNLPRNQAHGRPSPTQQYVSPAPANSRPSPATPAQNSTQEYITPGSSQTRPHPHATSPHPTAGEQVKVFITYATEFENPNHTRTVVQISQTLLQNSIDVSVDVLEETIRSMSSSEWLDNSITNSDFVLICVSPGYRKVVEGQSSSSQTTFHEKEKAVNTQYIYRRIHAEYIRNGSKNYRFIPVLLSGAAIEHIPPWLRDTRVFEWPKNYEDIIFRLFRKERFIKPKPGPPPRHTVERYSTYSERSTNRDFDRENGSNTEAKQMS